MLSGQTIPGDSVSRTVTVNEQVLVPPFSRKVFVVVPKGNAEPEGSPEISVALGGGVYTTTAVHTPKSLPLTILPGQLMEGGELLVRLPGTSVAKTLPCANRMQAKTEINHLIDLVRYILLFIAADLLTNLNL